jgi:hypothetical protein
MEGVDVVPLAGDHDGVDDRKNNLGHRKNNLEII